MAHVANPPDIDVAILLGKAESLGEIGADFVAVENLDAMRAFAEFVGDQIRKRGFSRSGKTGKPQGKALIHLQKSNSRKNRLLGEPQKLLNLVRPYNLFDSYVAEIPEPSPPRRFATRPPLP